MQGSAQSPHDAAVRRGLSSSFTNQRPASATSLSFPTKPPGASQRSNPPNGAVQALAQPDHRLGDLDLYHHRPHRRTVSAYSSSSVYNFDQDDKVAVYGSHSFTLRCDNYSDLYSCNDSDSAIHLPPDLQFAHLLDNTITKHDVYEKDTYSVPILSAPPGHRSLTFNSIASNDEMTTITTSAPNSPPALTRSKSSKSSSLQSSQFGGVDDFNNDSSHFEEIGLGEETASPTVDPTFWQTNRYAKGSRSTITSIRSQPNTPSPDPADENKRLTYPSLHGQVENVLRRTSTNITAGANPQTQNGAPKVALKRGFTVPATATFPLQPSQFPPRTRSSSPSPHLPLTAPFNPTARNLRHKPLSRPPSMQSNRKSTLELEAEYHDSDDELPEDASLWNVPMSPRPPLNRPGSNRTSMNGSPERELVSEGPRPIPLAHATTAPESPPRHPLSQSLPRVRPPPRTSSLQTAKSTASSPTSSIPQSTFRDSRAKSWTLAMADLSEEAQIISETLEHHEDHKGRVREANVQNGVRSGRSSMESTRKSARSSAIELPPIQKGNILIDPMPPSKEKEAVLTRTRPSWLPPKDPKEERRHLREYQQMMAASIDSDKRKSERMKIEQCEKDDTREALNRIWDQYVNPEWDRATHEHRTRELWWRGINPKIRGQVWARAVGNPLGLTRKSYDRALQRVQDLRARPVESRSDKDREMMGWIANIEKDVPSVFPELNLFQSGSPLCEQLIAICSAYVAYRSDVGYLYGLQVN